MPNENIIRTLENLAAELKAEPAPAGFVRGNIIRTTQELHDTNGNAIPAGTLAVYVGSNAERPKQYVDVTWIGAHITDNGKRWKGERFERA